MENSESKPKPLTFKELFEADQKKVMEAAVAFDIDDFTKGADDPHTVFVPNIGRDKKGRIIRYKRFNAEDTQKLEPYLKESNYNRGLRALALMMFKADGKTTYEKLLKIPVEDAAAILLATSEPEKNFQPPTSEPMV